MLFYNRHRYYDPVTAQYLSPDPIGLLGGINPYGYVHNPTGWVDPLGLVGDCNEGKGTTGTGQVGNAASELPVLPPGKQGSVIRNELLGHEYKQALDIVGYKGGMFKGATEKSQAGIDGWLNGVPVQLKEVQGQSVHSIRKNIVGGANDMAKAGYNIYRCL